VQTKRCTKSKQFPVFFTGACAGKMILFGMAMAQK
jgi:hypothetical protein